jgi:hypothetical protein
MGAKRRAKMSMPCTRRLFETIDGFNQATEMSRMRRINKSRRYTLPLQAHHEGKHFEHQADADTNLE